MHFSWPHMGCTLIAVESLILIDRALAFGDVVKRQPSDTASGCVIRTSTLCTIQPIYNGLPFSTTHPWPHKEKDNILCDIPGSDLEYMYDFHVGDYVLYCEWIGVIEDVWEDVTVRLDNGSIVIVEKSEELEILDPDLSAFPSSAVRGARLADILAHTRDLSLNARALDLVDTGFRLDPPVLHLGQSVFTKKGNLRRGRFIYGSYDPNVPPHGIIVDLKTTELDIRWLSRNVFDETRVHAEAPPIHLDRGDFGEIILYDKSRAPHYLQAVTSVGSAQGSDFAVGDVVKFRDSAGAAVKFGDDDHGTFRRIPRELTQGYDMNAFLITKTKTKVTIQWQDVSTSDVDAVSVVPYLNVDDHDVWPGELVSIKVNKAENGLLNNPNFESESCPGVTKLKNVGVVQSADASERLAKIRWYTGPEVSILEGYDDALLAGSHLGALSSNETDISFYEIVTHPALTKRRGDLVLVAPSVHPVISDPLAIQMISSSDRGRSRPPLGDICATRSSESNTKANWFGEVVDLGLDGFLTVRLGALDHVRDIRVPVEATITVVGDDDSLTGSLADEDERLSWIESWDSGSDVVIEETVEYEGGTRLDADSDSEMWSTDEENDDASKKSSTHQPTTDTKKAEPLQRLEHVHNASKAQQIKFTAFPNMPAQFEIVDESPPINHNFYSQSVLLSATLMRRIRKEHKILESSLPEGIWVRTWEDRLDLLRVLIIGPEETPYTLAPFVLDFHLNQDFPHSPPEAYFHSWTRGLGRINPNLYEDGKVCLSLLGTWQAERKDESWSEDSTLLQVFVSLMGLVLVEEPFYNEAGFDAYVGSSETRINSALYTEKAFVMAKGFINHALSHPSQGIESILRWLYLPISDGPCLLQRVLTECDKLLNEASASTASTESSGRMGLRLSSGAKVLLRKYATELKTLLAGGER